MASIYIPEIKTARTWSIESVREACIHNNFYATASEEIFNRMLAFVSKTEPTTINLYRVAFDICAHAEDDLEPGEVMGVIEREAVTTAYEVRPFNPFEDYLNQ